ncbi:NlpC/P60 family protein [Actinoplanes sp. NPDC049118]|uniref:C40 family peptidase n=1 Tax=Actinoplanes sp. NPDC049118 TaxID=3155769 RepID=UPI0033E6812D
MIDGITIIAWAPIVAAQRLTTGTVAPWAVPNWDSRECPGPNSEASLSRPSTRRVLAASALALAVSSPALENVEFTVKIATPVTTPAVPAQQQRMDQRAMQRVSRSVAHRSAIRPVGLALRSAQRSTWESAKITAVSRKSQARRAGAHRRDVTRRAVAARQTDRPVADRTRAEKPRHTGHRRGKGGRHYGSGKGWVRMTSVIEYARSQLGKNYRRGGDGPNSFDCSGFTKRAYARVGLRLPHSSGGQAARARSISRKAARPGDLVVGPGHVGIYMGGGMMIDAGNPRTGVVYRRLYGGLHIERF